MGYKVILSPQALERLEQIVQLIAQDNPEAAQRFGFKLIERAELLSRFPELGTRFRRRPHVRRLLCKPYFIYYRLKDAERLIEVMDFWHAARQEPEI